MTRAEEIYQAFKTRKPYKGRYIVGIKEAIELAANEPHVARIEFPATASDVKRPDNVVDWNELLKSDPQHAQKIAMKMLREFYQK